MSVYLQLMFGTIPTHIWRPQKKQTWMDCKIEAFSCLKKTSMTLRIEPPLKWWWLHSFIASQTSNGCWCERKGAIWSLGVSKLSSLPGSDLERFFPRFRETHMVRWVKQPFPLITGLEWSSNHFQIDNLGWCYQWFDKDLESST